MAAAPVVSNAVGSEVERCPGGFEWVAGRGCTVIPEKDAPPDDRVELPPPDGTKRLRARDGISEISIPDRWDEMTDLNDEAKLEAGNAVAEEYVIVLTEAKSDFATPIDLARYADINLATMRTVVPGAQISHPRSLTIDGREAAQYEIRGVVDGLDIVYLATYVAGRAHVHQVVMWSIASHFEAARADFERVAESFREL